jgi:hypothetical protein
VLGRKDLLRWPAFGYSVSQGRVIYSESPRPLTQTISFPVVCQESCFASVLSLLHSGCPFAVRRPAIRDTFLAVTARIIAVIIYPLNAVFSGRLFTHVFQEIDERVSPLLTYMNRSIAVTMVVLIVRVVASLLHGAPRAVFSRVVPTSSTCAMATTGKSATFAEFATSHNSCVSAFTSAQPSGISRLCFFSEFDDRKFGVHIADFVSSVFAASARLDVSRPNGVSTKNLLDAAFASAQPVCSSLASKVSSSVANRRKISKWLSSDIFDTGASDSRITRRHDLTPDKLDCDRAESVHNDCFGSFYFIRM